MIDWNDIDTVFLDMDGTLLDLHYDNYFWLVHLPRRYGELNGVPEEKARETLHALYQSQQGTLNWYCIDFWTATLGVNIPQLKEEVAHLVAFRPHVESFLETLQRTHHRVVVVTNSHRKGLAIKLAVTKLDRFVDRIVSAHDVGLPKETVRFWEQLQAIEPFDPVRTLFIDDTVAVLDAARAYGIKYLLTVLQPDSTGTARKDLPYDAIDRFNQLTVKL